MRQWYMPVLSILINAPGVQYCVTLPAGQFQVLQMIVLYPRQESEISINWLQSMLSTYLILKYG